MPATHGQIDRSVNHPRAFGKVHPEEKDVAPTAVRKVHSHCRSLSQNRIRSRHIIKLQQRFLNTKRNIRRVARAKHPLVPSHCSNTAANLIRQCLKRQVMIRLRQRAGQSNRRTIRSLRRQKPINGFREAATKQVLVSTEWNRTTFLAH